MVSGADGIDRSRRDGRLVLALALAGWIMSGYAAPATAQMFSDRPPPVPPALVPEISAPAMNLAPPSGPPSITTLNAPLPQPSIAAVPPVVAPQGAAAPGQGMLSLTARSSKIPQNQISFAIYKGSQFEIGERASLLPNVAAGDVALLPEGTYYIISNYGDANSVVRSDIRVQAGKLTDVTITHRAAVITLKLVSDKGGEALANTAWSVITPGGDVIKESIGAFPRVVLSEGEYRAMAKNEGKVYERPFSVVNGVDGEIEVVAR